ncbi:MAG: hypothetical protein JSS06_00035 [Proteobacteria bacterium]|nr:hypothetical protein [Pseudomonadota bacterium]
MQSHSGFSQHLHQLQPFPIEQFIAVFLLARGKLDMSIKPARSENQAGNS